MSQADTRPGPRYEAVKQHITKRIGSGEWEVGQRLPSETELVDRLGVSRMTVHRALRELTQAGIVTRMQGVGSFVAAPEPPRAEFLELRDVAEDIEAGGRRHSAQVIAQGAVRADRELATAFDRRPGAKLFHSTILHCEDDTPLQLEQRHVSPHFAPDYLDQDFSRTITTRYLQAIAPPDEIEHVVFAITPTPELCTLLRLEQPEACLQLVRRTWVGGEVVTRGVFTCPGSRYSLGGRRAV